MNKNIIWVIVLVVLCAGSYYMGKSAGVSSAVATAGATGQNRVGGQFGGRGGNRAAGGFVIGQIVAKDATSITVEIRNGTSTDAASTGAGSKIVFVSDTTTVLKTVQGSPADLAVGTNVSVQGTPNSDGSVTATNVQIRPAGMGGDFNRPAGQ